MDGSEVSSLIRDFLRDGKIEKANKILTRNGQDWKGFKGREESKRNWI